MEQTYTIKNQGEFKLKDIFECGQCFRWNKQEDESYIGVFENNVVQVWQEGKTLIFEGECEGNFQKQIEKYFDLKRDYKEIQNKLAKIDKHLKIGIEYGKGIRILNQDLWETIISFIISANNNIPRIKGIIERLSLNYGTKIIYKEKEYYAFPTAKQLKDVSIEEYRKLGLGFRDKRLYETTKMILNKEVDIDKMDKLSTEEARKELLKLSGVGPKVADCILLFSTLKRFDVFPIDVWVRRVMNDLYIHDEDETKVSKNKIENLAKEKFGDLQGMAQQYLFYWRREN